MKESIQRLLVCPGCRSELALEVLRSDGEEILEGFFSCACGARYPVIGGVPRMLPNDLLVGLEEDYPEFFRTHRPQAGAAGDVRTQTTDKQRRTQKAFGYEWTWADDYDADNFSDWLPDGFEAETLFRGKVGLEVGCGAGRHAARTSSIAAEHFAVDLSRAVDAAFERNRDVPNCHVIQADAFNLPFRERTFEYVYCLGVLQHMPDPEAGFQALAKQPKAGGVLVANVYAATRPVSQFLLEVARKITTRLPHSLLKVLSIAAGYFEYGIFIGPWRWLRSKRLGRWLRPIVPERIDRYADYDLHTCVTDWFDRLSCPVKKHYKREDVFRWYRTAGYADVAVTPFWKAFWNGYGKRTTA